MSLLQTNFESVTAAEIKSILVWGFPVPASWLTQAESTYLSALPLELPSVRWVWAEMDRVSHECGLDNRRSFTGQPIGNFYSHPVWLMNGIFTAVDPVSVSHRRAIAQYICSTGARCVADYGGGFGELALALTRIGDDVRVSVVEPYPSRVALERFRGQPSIDTTSELATDCYDVVVAQDVLEHVEDPIKLAHDLAHAVRRGGLIIFANCFYPVIECHLPKTFHLRHTFPLVMNALGLRYAGFVEGAEHAKIFVRTDRLDLAKARTAEKVSKVLGPFVNVAAKAGSYLVRLVRS